MNWSDKLKEIFTAEQLEQIAQVLSMTHALAVERESCQEFTITFNAHGYPTGFNGSNWIRPAKPTTYKAE